jgi:CheY-like chemotaxis protein
MTASRSLCVLLVDDQDDMLRLMTRLLRADGYTVYTARSAQEATDLAARKACDLVISDIGLPDRSGVELMKELRTMYGLKGIALSGYTSKEDVEACSEAGFAKHLAKPVEYSNLLRAIEAVMSGD